MVEKIRVAKAMQTQPKIKFCFSRMCRFLLEDPEQGPGFIIDLLSGIARGCLRFVGGEKTTPGRRARGWR